MENHKEISSKHVKNDIKTQQSVLGGYSLWIYLHL